VKKEPFLKKFRDMSLFLGIFSGVNLPALKEKKKNAF